MSSNEPKAASGNQTRKQRRAAERARRKGGSSPAPRDDGRTGRRGGPSMFVLSLAAVIVALVAVAGLVLVSGGFDDEATAVSQPDVAPPAPELREGRTLVAPGATPPVVIEAFEDPQCPACAQFTERIEPLIIAEHVRNGTASFTYRDFPVFGESSVLAAAAMRAADELDGKFWDYHQVLFHNQGEVSSERLAAMAELIGLDREAFLEELDDPVHRAAIEAEREAGVELGVNSTPTILVNGQLFRGVPTWDELDAAILAAAEAAEAAGDAATDEAEGTQAGDDEADADEAAGSESGDG